LTDENVGDLIAAATHAQQIGPECLDDFVEVSAHP
jgi:hypothetical protein